MSVIVKIKGVDGVASHLSKLGHVEYEDLEKPISSE